MLGAAAMLLLRGPQVPSALGRLSPLWRVAVGAWAISRWLRWKCSRRDSNLCLYGLLVPRGGLAHCAQRQSHPFCAHRLFLSHGDSS